MPIKLTITKDENGVPVLAKAAKAISAIESEGSGGYAAIGPKTKSGDRAYGKYQVMGANIPAWTKEAIGKSMTAKEFLADPNAQEAVFKHKFGGYIQQYGPQGAAAMWFSGKPDVNSTASDGSNTVGQYVNKFNTQLGSGNTQFGLPVVPAAAKIYRPDFSPGTEGAAAPGAFGGGGGRSFGSGWRNQTFVDKYAKERGIEPGKLQAAPMEPNVVPMLERSPLTLQEPMKPSPSWVLDKNANSLGLPQRIASAVRTNGELKPLLGKWLNDMNSKTGDAKLQSMQKLAQFLKENGF